MTSLRRTALTMMLALSTMVAGCANKPWLMDETTLTPKPISLVESRHIVKKPLAALSAADIADAARIYEKTGAGPMYVVVAHSDHAKGDLAARTKGIVAALQKQGVNPANIVESTVPLTTEQPVALIAFDTLEASAPEGCGDMPGLDSPPGQTTDFDYKLGCGIKGLMARQIANPKDLNGVAGLGGQNDGERAANVVNGTLRSGQTRAFLPSYVISSLAGSGS